MTAGWVVWCGVTLFWPWLSVATTRDGHTHTQTHTHKHTHTHTRDQGKRRAGYKNKRRWEKRQGITTVKTIFFCEFRVKYSKNGVWCLQLMISLYSIIEVLRKIVSKFLGLSPTATTCQAQGFTLCEGHTFRFAKRPNTAQWHSTTEQAHQNRKEKTNQS